MLALGLTLVAVLLQAEEDLLTADGDIKAAQAAITKRLLLK